MDATAHLDESAVFVKVIEMGSFSEAARQLKVPTSTVSRQVQRLEDSLGVRLIQRTTRKLVMTDAGVEFYRRVSPAIDAVKEARDLVRGYTNEPRGTLRVTVPVDLANTVLGPMIARFSEAHPQVTIDLIITNRKVDLIGEGVDLAIRAGPLSDSSLIALKLGTTDFWLVAAPSYLSKHGTPKRIEQLSQHQCVLFRSMEGRWNLVGPRGPVTVDVSGKIIADDFGFLRSAVLAGAGIGFLPALSVAARVRRGQLERVLPRYSYPGSSLHLVYPSSQHVPAKLAVFRDFITKEFAKYLD